MGLEWGDDTVDLDREDDLPGPNSDEARRAASASLTSTPGVADLTVSGSADAERSTLQILIEARAKIDAPHKWGKGLRFGNRSRKTCCTVEAIAEVNVSVRARLCALESLLRATGSRAIVSWNDAPERTHAEVLAAFDRAIAAERAKEGAQ